MMCGAAHCQMASSAAPFDSRRAESARSAVSTPMHSRDALTALNDQRSANPRPSPSPWPSPGHPQHEGCLQDAPNCGNAGLLYDGLYDQLVSEAGWTHYFKQNYAI